MFELTNPLQREDVIRQFAIEKDLTPSQRKQMMRIAAGSLLWFVALSIGLSYFAGVAVTAAPPVVMCDPVFVAELPGSGGVVLNIGHFDEVAGVTHVEI
jgi:hypothetical protein